MVIETGQLQLEKHAHLEFQRLWNAGNFRGLRYGQAFYQHFRLERLADQRQLKGLNEQDGDEAKTTIGKVFRFN